jgi:hypothetical protein
MKQYSLSKNKKLNFSSTGFPAGETGARASTGWKPISANLRAVIFFRVFLIYPIVTTAYAVAHVNPRKFGANFPNNAGSSS